MKKILPIIVVGIFVFSGFGAVALNNDIEKFNFEIFEYENIGGNKNAFTHTILGEFGTATWCGYCKYAHAALKNIYAGGEYPFYYVTLVDDKNKHAAERNDEMGLTGFPTVWFDGGYKTVIGAGSVESAQAAYTSSIVSCGNRGVNDIDITLDIEWQAPGNPSPENGDTNAPIDECLTWTDAEMKISVSIDNNEGSSYNGHLRVYVTEVISSMGWYDSGGQLYTFPFLDYAFNEGISISASQTWEDDTYWDGKDHNNGYGDDFSGITQENTMVIAAVFDDVNEYVDETAGLLAGVNTDPKTYDVYFGESNPPPKVSSNQSDLEYCPGDELDFSTTYYWQIVAWDDQGSSTTGPLWSFTTRGNDPPNTPSDPDPEDDETGVPINTCISWTSEDPDGDDVTYDVYFGECGEAPPLVWSNKTSSTYCPAGNLDYGTCYVWMIVAWDEYDYSTIGPTWEFTTEENLPPNTPSEPIPPDGETDVSIEEILRWVGGDPNSGDTVTYDVYFGKSNPPPLVDEDLPNREYNPSTMDFNTTYYWQIVAEDSQGLTATGPIWYFTTEELNHPPTTPDIDGPTEGSPGVVLCWTFHSDDPDNNLIKYIIKWGDGTSDETDYHSDSKPVEVCHTFAKGDYIIEASSEDQKGLASGKNTYKVKITTPRSRTAYHPLLLRLFERFPNLFPMLERLLSLIRLI